MRIEDQHGTSWKVEAHDPASIHINKLKRRGFEYVVLPRLTYMIGSLIEPDTGLPVVRQYRLADCLAVLKGEV